MNPISLKSSVTKAGTAHYVLPKTGLMKVDAHAFLSEPLFEASEEAIWTQIQNGASYEGVIGAYLLPDAHSGYGVPIGSCLVTDRTIIQGCSGFDVGCGVLGMTTSLHASDIADKSKRRQWISEIERRMSMGKGSHRADLMVKYSGEQAEEILRFGAKALGVEDVVCERQYIPVGEAFDSKRIDRAHSLIVPQLGSLGSGNHFCELQCDEETGQVFIMVHCGSRGYGWQTANHYFHKGAELRGLPDNRREDSWLYADEPLGKEYWAHHNSAANFAVANRHIIVDGVRTATWAVFGNAEIDVYYEISHNLVQEETLVLPDGSARRGFVHRKGATRAFPAGHPDLVGTRWEKTGHPCLIAGSMISGAAIVFPQDGAYKSSCTVNHGSGRVLGRKEAQRQLGPKQSLINSEMRDVVRTFGGVEVVGILSNHRDVPIDESGRCYKDLDEVLSVLEAENIGKVVQRLWPVANLKGAD